MKTDSSVPTPVSRRGFLHRLTLGAAALGLPFASAHAVPMEASHALTESSKASDAESIDDDESLADPGWSG